MSGLAPRQCHTQDKKPQSLRLSFFFFLFLFLRIYVFIIDEYTVAVFRCARRGHQIPLQMVVSYHMVVGI